MIQFKKYTKKQLAVIFIGLVLLFFIDDLLIVILIRQFGYLKKSWWITGGIIAWLFLASAGLAFAVLKVKKTKPTTGGEGLLGELGKVITMNGQNCQVLVHGEIWTAESAAKLHIGDRISVIGMDGLTLLVEKNS